MLHRFQQNSWDRFAETDVFPQLDEF